jgi:hypothetical protein
LLLVEKTMSSPASLALASMQLEEISVRANLALTQKKFLNEALPLDVEEKAESEEEYAALCAQVVSFKGSRTASRAGKHNL